MQTDVHYVQLWYLIEVFLEWRILQTEVVKKSETFYAQSIFSENVPFMK